MVEISLEWEGNTEERLDLLLLTFTTAMLASESIFRVCFRMN